MHTPITARHANPSAGSHSTWPNTSWPMAQEKDNVVFGKKEAKQCLAALDHERRSLMKINDKGGVVVVADGEALITTYNCSQRH